MMLVRALEALKRTTIIWVYASFSLIWIILLILLDLGVFAMTGKNTIDSAREESEVSSPSQTGCLDIDGVKICD